MTGPTLAACACVVTRYKSLVGVRELPAANGENCVLMLRKLCPLRPGAYHVGVTKVPLLLLLSSSWLFFYSSCTILRVVVHLKYPPLSPSPFSPLDGQLFLKEDVYQLLECKRERTRQLAALTLQRYARMFFIRKRFLAFRGKIVALQARCRGFLMRSAKPSDSNTG